MSHSGTHSHTEVTTVMPVALPPMPSLLERTRRPWLACTEPPLSALMRSMSDDALPLIAALRMMLLKVLVDDTGMRILCTDYFPSMKRHIGSQMGFQDMLTALLSWVEPDQIVVALRKNEEFSNRLSHYLIQLQENIISDERMMALAVGLAPLFPELIRGSSNQSNQAQVATSPDSGNRRPSLVPAGSAYTASFYVPRPDEEQRALDKLEACGAAVVLRAPERAGKTWLLEHLIRQAQERGVVVRIDLMALAQSSDDLPSLLRAFLREIMEQVGVTSGDEDTLQAILDKEFSRPKTIDRICASLMERHILPKVGSGTSSWLLLAIDGADSLLGRDEQDEFFTMLRAWMGATARPLWAPLRLVLALSTAPHLLVKNIDQSPFNIAETINLNDFTANQTDICARRLRLSWTKEECEAVLGQVGGHPWLVHITAYETARKALALSTILSDRNRFFKDYLDHTARRLRRDAELCTHFLRAMTDSTARLPLDALTRLRYAGLLSDEPGPLRSRYPILQLLPGHL